MDAEGDDLLDVARARWAGDQHQVRGHRRLRRPRRPRRLGEGPQDLGGRRRHAAGRHDAEVHGRQEAGGAPSGGGRRHHDGAGGRDGSHARGDAEIGGGGGVGRERCRGHADGRQLLADRRSPRARRRARRCGCRDGPPRRRRGRQAPRPRRGRGPSRRRPWRCARTSRGRRPRRASTIGHGAPPRVGRAWGGRGCAARGLAAARGGDRGTAAVGRLRASPPVIANSSSPTLHSSPAFQRCRNERAAGFGAERPPPHARSPGAIAAKRLSGLPSAAAFRDAR